MYFAGFFLILIALFVLIALIKMVWMGLFSIGFGGFVLLAVALTALFAMHRNENNHLPPRMAHEKPGKLHKPHKHHRPLHHRPHHPPSVLHPPPVLSDQLDQAEPSPILTGPDDSSVVDLQEDSLGEQATAMTEIIRDQHGDLILQQDVSEIPDWVRSPQRSVTRQGTTLILHSQRFATVEEARQQLWPVLKSAIMEDLSQQHSGIWGWSPTLAEVEKTGILKRECNITYPLQIGNFEESVHQVCWQVQFNDSTHAQLSSSWRPLLVRNRLNLLAAGFFAAMILLSLGALTLHRRSDLASPA